jgi:hypothetical protein
MENYVLPSSLVIKPQSKEKVHDDMLFSHVPFSSSKANLILNVS